MNPLSMRHFILIKRRSRLNVQPAALLLKEILNRNSGEPPGFITASGDRKICRTKPQNTFISNTINKNHPPFTPPARPWRGKGDSFHFPPPRERRNSPGGSTPPPMTRNLHSQNRAARTCGAPLRRQPAGKRRFRLPSFHQKRRLPTEPGKAAQPLLKRRIKAGKRRPCPEGTWRSGASAGRRRPHPPSRAPERPSSRWKPSFLPRPSEPLHGRP